MQLVGQFTFIAWPAAERFSESTSRAWEFELLDSPPLICAFVNNPWRGLAKVALRLAQERLCMRISVGDWASVKTQHCPTLLR